MTAKGLHDFLAKVIRFTFWPSLAVTLLLLAFGRPLLSLFGPDFGDGHHLMFIMADRARRARRDRADGALSQHARAAARLRAGLCVGLRHQCRAVPAADPTFGAIGAAIAIATALIVETLSLALVAKHKLGFNVFIWGRRA